jgi:hypothetical protein
MNREVQVRICEGLGVKFPGPTRRVSRVSPVQTAVQMSRKRQTPLFAGGIDQRPVWLRRRCVAPAPGCDFMGMGLMTRSEVRGFYCRRVIGL